MKTFIRVLQIQMLVTLLFSSVAFGMGWQLPKPQPTPVPTPAPTPKPSPTPVAGNYVPLWNGKHADASKWTATVRQLIEENADALYRGPDDVEDFCPMYNRLGREDRLNFWVEFTAGVVKYESGFNPASRMRETTMDTDPYTGEQVFSEGLLQLSYQDERSYGTATCDFDFNADRQYSKTDLRRSILDYRKNLSCGLKILNRQVDKRGNIALSANVYWAVLKINGKYSKLNEIRAITNKLSFCKQ